MKNALFIALIVIQISEAYSQKRYTLSSPDKTITVRLVVDDSISYSVNIDKKELIKPSYLSLKTEKNPANNWKVIKETKRTVKEVLKPVVWQKTENIIDHYNQLTLSFGNGLSLEWRAFDNGVAWRWVSGIKGKYKILKEDASFNFGTVGKSWYPQENDFFSHNEREYKNYPLDSIPIDKKASLPALFEVKGVKILLTESNLFNYPGMWIEGGRSGTVAALFPQYPKEKKIVGDRSEKVVSREDFLANIDGEKNFPWRILMIARDDKELLINQLVYQLSDPASEDYSWVKPGKVQWDWWHYNNIYGVDFRAGINNDTYKYYIDFASKYGIEYVLLDEGWCDTEDLMKQSPDINVEELAKYSKSKNVGLILWTSWLVLDRQLDTALNIFESWGIKGIKVDFMQRDDQDMVNYYEKVSTAAADRKLLVDFHGAYKPTGWLRTYPNVLTSEGVLGNEISKFAPLIDPEHTTTLPFIRMVAGPMDFTPGGMLNAQKDAFAINPAEPMTLGTRCNQLAMYVLYESPLQMLCDLPTHYYKEPECMEFLKVVPTEWKATIPLHAKIGDYVAMARESRKGEWFIGAMTDWTERELSFDLLFLGDGDYQMEIWRDGINADRNAKDFKRETLSVDKKSNIKIKMAPGGGWVARIIKV